MARSTTPRDAHIGSNVQRIFTVESPSDARREAAYHAECAAFEEDFFDSRENRATRALMQGNRAPFLS